MGDLGRVRATFDHEVAMPAIGSGLTGQPNSSFNQTDQEKLMHNRVWRFLVAPHSKDWFYDTAVEFQRTKLTSATDHKFKVDRYYDWLQNTEYASSRVRYSTVASHIDADIATIPETFAAICAVIEVDRNRALSASTLTDIEAKARQEVVERKIENDMSIGWFVRALRYRYDSYDYALDHLLVETPHEEALIVDERLGVLESYVGRAERYDFCGGGQYHTGLVLGESLPSRILMSPPDEGEYLK